MKGGRLLSTAVDASFWLAWLLLVSGLLIPSPVAGFFLSFLVVTCGILPLAFSTRKQRIAAVIALILGVVLAGVQVRKAGNDPYFKRAPVLSLRTG